MAVTVGGFFSGTGGIEYAARSCGADIVFSCEKDPYARATYRANLGHDPWGDIRGIDTIPEVDLVVAGFPCQPFSKAGVSKNRSMGLHDGFMHATSGTMFGELVRVLEAAPVRPRALFLENVRNLVHHDRGNTWRVIVGSLEELGYRVQHRVIDAACVVPQHRQRVYIVATQEGIAYDWPELPRTFPALRTILEPDGPATRERTIGAGTWAALLRHKADHGARGNGFGYSIADPDAATRTLSARYYKDGAEILIAQEGGERPRKLTVREAFRLQGYPDSFVLPEQTSKLQLYKQAGNGVVVPLLTTLLSPLVAALGALGNEVAEVAA